MSMSFSRAPHIEGAGAALHSAHAPNAALLIDFDNVTMGMRSDLSKELKTLLNSDIIRGKVTVQRAYADWRRYPQYIVPLSEASIDLIFAPAYGSNKKNATDIRMAIDGMELVFTRPEIGTYILLTGDSDFSSLVLKLKEYGKYVIGVGIQESSSDILVQNCDEYYSYTALSGLRKTDESGAGPLDPWVLVERAVEQMVKRGDVMRSDRLKQVMLELDPGFDEKGLGFSKFSRFLSEASGKGIVRLQKMENGQFEIAPASGARRGDERKDVRRPDRGRAERPRGEGEANRPRGGRDNGPRRGGAPAASGEGPTVDAAPSGTAESGELTAAYELLTRAISALLGDQESESVRDSDVKRRMLAMDGGFDEGKLGFPKFSRFLRQAHDDEVVNLEKDEDGIYHLTLAAAGGRAKAVSRPDPADTGRSTESAAEPEAVRSASSPPEGNAPAEGGFGGSDPRSAEETPVRESFWSRWLRPRDSSSRGAPDGEPPPLFEGQAVPGRGSAGSGASSGGAEGSSRDAEAPSGPVGSVPPTPPAGPRPEEPVLDPASLHLPTERASMIQYLTNSYGGVGERTAEALVTALGDDLFVVLQRDPSRVEALLPPARAEKVLEGWAADLERRRARHGGVPLVGSPEM